MITYHYAEVSNLKIFYREAGRKDAPTIVLLHGFPTSSFMFRNLIPLLAETNHVIAPDYPGFGFSDAPSVDDFEYTFASSVFEWPCCVCSQTRLGPGPRQQGRHVQEV